MVGGHDYLIWVIDVKIIFHQLYFYPRPLILTESGIYISIRMIPSLEP